MFIGLDLGTSEFETGLSITPTTSNNLPIFPVSSSTGSDKSHSSKMDSQFGGGNTGGTWTTIPNTATTSSSASPLNHQHDPLLFISQQQQQRNQQPPFHIPQQHQFNQQFSQHQFIEQQQQQQQFVHQPQSPQQQFVQQTPPPIQQLQQQQQQRFLQQHQQQQQLQQIQLQQQQQNQLIQNQQSQNQQHQSIASHFHLLPLVEKLAGAVETGTRDQQADAMISELNSQFENCLKLLNSVATSFGGKAVTVEGQKHKLEESELLLNQRRDLISKYKSSVEELTNSQP